MCRRNSVEGRDDEDRNYQRGWMGELRTDFFKSLFEKNKK